MRNEHNYWKMVERNVGMLGEERQEKLRNSCVPVFGVGGIGAIVAELLVRSGVGALKIVDIDRYDHSNMNRQIYAFNSTIGQRKEDVTKRFLLDINPDLEIEVFHETNDETISHMLSGATVALMCIDQLVPSIHVARRCREAEIPMIETVAMPYMNLRVYDSNTLTFEAFHAFPTENKSIDELYNLSENEMEILAEQFIKAFVGIEKITDFYSQKAIEKMKNGYFATFAPMVWMQASMVALEAIKILLDWGEISYAPNYALYDPFQHKMLPPINLALAGKTGK